MYDVLRQIAPTRAFPCGLCVNDAVKMNVINYTLTYVNARRRTSTYVDACLGLSERFLQNRDANVKE